MGLPIAWCIQQSESAEQICLFLQSVKDTACSMKPDWKPSYFIIDCAKAEVKALTAIFPDVPIYFCSWHVRRAWKENLVKKVPNREKFVEMNDDLGDLMYASSESHMQELWLQFQHKYHTEKDFLAYFRETWMHRTAKWMRAMRDMPRANQNTNGVVKAWHLLVKRMIKRVLGCIQALRMDKVVKFMFANVLPYFWYQLRCKERGIVPNNKKEHVVLHSLHLAQHHMTDAQVSFPFEDMPNCAIVQSSEGNGKEYTVRNIYSNFPSRSCEWAEQEGNMCKHQLKALLIKGHQGGVLVQQLGTRFGSQFGGIDHLQDSPDQHTTILTLSSAEPINVSNTHVIILLGCCSSNIEPHEAGGQGEQEDTQDVLASEELTPTSSSKRQLLQTLVDEMFGVVQSDEELQDQAIIGLKITIGKLKLFNQGKTITGKDTVAITNAFVRLAGLTSKRRLGLVDLFHGGQRGKRLSTQRIKKKKSPKKTSQDVADQSVHTGDKSPLPKVGSLSFTVGM
ncbi:unnamed protein product [Calypogeia fissa]